MEFKITILCENTVTAPGLLGEHGFSALVETPDGNILFDTGQGLSIVRNSLRLHKDLKKVSKLVLSHGHFDHTGGVPAFLEIKGPCPIAAHPDIFSERFRMAPTGGGDEKPLSIGIPWTRTYLSTRGAQFEWYRSFSEVAPNVYVTGEVPRKTLFELGSPQLVVHRDSGWAPDPFLDDLSLVLKTTKGLAVILGCAHAGVVNILEHSIAQTGENRIYAVLGGTHLGLSPEPQFDPTVRALKEFDIRLLAGSHCTGQGSIARLAFEFGKKFVFGHVGFALEI